MDEAVAEVAEIVASAAAMDKREMDLNGWFESKDNPISKVGVFDYHGSQLPNAPDKNRMYKVYRPAEELGSAECIDSFKLIPWIDNHVMLGREEDGFTRPEQKGVQGVIGQDVHFDAEDGVLYGNLKLFSSAMADSINAGKRELSCGYRCTYDWTPGITADGQAYDAVQRTIRGNHLALVKQGRMGPDVAVLDHSDTVLTFTCDSTFENPTTMAEQTSNTAADAADHGGASLVIDQAQFAKLISGMDELTKQVAVLTARAADADEKKDDDKDEDKPKDDAKDAEVPENLKKDDEDKDDKDDKKAEDAMDAAAIDRRVSEGLKAGLADRARAAALAAQLSKHVGTFDHSAMDEAQVAAYGVGKLGLKNVPKGQEATALSVYFQTSKPDSEKPVAKTGAMDGGSWLLKQKSSFGR